VKGNEWKVSPVKGNEWALMKESSLTVANRGQPTTKRKKRRGGLTFSNAKGRKLRKQREARKSLSIVGRGTPSDLREIGDCQKAASWRGRCKIRTLNLEPMERGKESSPSGMTEGKPQTGSNPTVSSEDIRDVTASTVSSCIRKRRSPMIQGWI